MDFFSYQEWKMPKGWVEWNGCCRRKLKNGKKKKENRKLPPLKINDRIRGKLAFQLSETFPKEIHWNEEKYEKTTIFVF